MKITFKSKGNFNRTTKLLNSLIQNRMDTVLNKYGEMGVSALMEATPKDTGLTSTLWEYKVVDAKNGKSIVWTNSNKNNGVPIAVIIQYGHGTRNGGYVEGIDYINPAIQPIFEKMIDEIWGEVR